MALPRRSFIAAALAASSGLGLPAARAQAGGRLTLAAAADLRFALDEIVQAWRGAQPAVRCDVVYGSSGKLTTQIRNGAPFDLFFSADRALPEGLHRDGLAATAPRVYAVGHLVAWSADAELGRLPLPELLRSPRVRRFAIANPEHAPYGQRAMEALRSQGLLDVARPKLVVGDNVAQAAQFVETGAAQAGLVSLSIVLAPALRERGAYTRIPASWHSPLEQAWVITRHGAGNPLVQVFTAHFDSLAMRATLRRFGFALPGEPAR